MLAWMMRTLTSRAAGPAAASVALILAAALAIAWSGWATEKRGLETRLAQLSRQSEGLQSLWKARLAACHAAAAGSRQVTEAAYARRVPPAEAQALLAGQPEGIDACARMESADQAVLSNLK